MIEGDRQIAATELGERKPQRSLIAAIAGAANVVLRRGSREVVASPTAEPGAQGSTARARAPLRLPNAYLASFVGIVVVPAILCIVYLAFFASNQYVAEARFAVQSAQFGFGDAKTGGAGGAASTLSVGAIPTMVSSDAYIVANYISSRSIIDDLNGKVDIRAIYQRPEADFWARLKDHASSEELTDYWKQMVGAYIDGPSGIVTLTVRAFRPADAEALAQAVIQASEALANDVSARARASIMREAEDEVRRSDGLVRAALADMRDFRDKQGFIDPLAAATSTSTLLMQTMGQEIALQSNYFVASKAMSPDAPTVVELKTRLDALDAQIAKLKGELTGDSPQGRTIATSLVTFEQLELKRQFAEKLFTLAQDALERARLKAEQQNIFISTFVPPDAPQEAKYPNRLSLSLLIPIGLAVLWGIFALIGAAVEDHRY